MQIRPLDPCGIAVSAFDPIASDDAEFARFRSAVVAAGFAVIEGVALDDAHFERFLDRLGPPAFTQGEAPLPGHPRLNCVSNVGRSRPPRSVFHTDTSYVSQPPSFTALRPVRVPSRGGETLLVDQYQAFATLPEPLRVDVDGAWIRHEVTGLSLEAGQERAARHPLFRRHPETGRTALYLSTPERCTGLAGFAEAEGRRLIEAVYAHSTRAEAVYRHSWQGNDLLVWDNRCTMHRADHSNVVGDRILHRGMCAGEQPESAG